MMRRFFAWSLILIATCALPFSAYAEYSSNICTEGPVCTREKVGPFMENISAACGNLGNCTLLDLEIVVVNVGRFVLSTIAAVVLLMYIIGGVYLLASRGDTGKITKGKNFIRTSTYGMLIVMFAYIAIVALVQMLVPPHLQGYFRITPDLNDATSSWWDDVKPNL